MPTSGAHSLASARSMCDDAVGVASWLRSRGEVLAGEVTISRVGSGQSNLTTIVATNPVKPCAVRLEFASVSPPYSEAFGGDGESFAPSHYEQLMRVRGSIDLGTNSFDVEGHGLRDHSWGPDR